MFCIAIARSNRDNVFWLAATAASSATDKTVSLKVCVNCNCNETKNDYSDEEVADGGSEDHERAVEGALEGEGEVDFEEFLDTLAKMAKPKGDVENG